MLIYPDSLPLQQLRNLCAVRRRDARFSAPTSSSQLGALLRFRHRQLPRHLAQEFSGHDVNGVYHRVSIILATARAHVPAISWQFEFARDGGLLSYGADLLDPLRRAASYVDRILRGAKPAELPVQLPTKFEMVVNLKTAKALGLTVPQSILLRADEVIE